MDLEAFIYKYNLVSTLTITDIIELCHVLNKKENRAIDYSNSINLYHLVTTFNKLSNYFQKDYQTLNPITLGENVELLNFYHHENDNYRCLTIYINNPNEQICNEDETLLYLIEKDGKITSIITNGINYFDKDYYKKEINIDEEIVKKYLDLGEKYSLFIDAYHTLKNKFIFGDGTTVLFSKINGELFEKITSFEITFGNHYFNTEDYINVPIKLGETPVIDYPNSKVILDLEEQENKKEIIDELLEKLFINKDKLPELYQKEKQLLKEKK